jgi:hypothetical protein
LRQLHPQRFKRTVPWYTETQNMSQLVFFNDAVPKKKLPTNLTTKKHPVHRWLNFIAGFSPEFVTKCIEESGVKQKEGCLIDPFAGMSTALVQANAEGVRSVGFEPHPFFYDVSLAKLRISDVQTVSLIEQACLSLTPFSGSLSAVWSPDAVKFLEKLVPDVELRLLASALQTESQIPPEGRHIFRLILSRTLEEVAQSQTDGIYKAPTSVKRSRRFGESVSMVCADIREDISAVSKYCTNLSSLYPHTSERMTELKDASCSVCVTSPPYLNNFDFAEMTRMELYFWKYAASWGEITERVRRNLIVNTTTAPTDLKRNQEAFKNSLSTHLRAKLDPVISALREAKKERGGSKDYESLVYPYFSQMQNVISELSRVLSYKAPFHMLVADAALYGVHIHTEHFLAELMQENGFRVESIDRMRNRGDRWILDKRQGSAEPLGEFHIHAERK